MSEGGQTILVGEDSRLHHKIYRSVLARLGGEERIQLLEAMDGGEAYGLYVTHPEISLVILDINMPVMNGYEFLERRQREGVHPSTPVLLVTSESRPEARARGLAAGAAGFLTKPFQPAELERIVRDLVCTGRAGACPPPLSQLGTRPGTSPGPTANGEHQPRPHE